MQERVKVKHHCKSIPSSSELSPMMNISSLMGVVSSNMTPPTSTRYKDLVNMKMTDPMLWSSHAAYSIPAEHLWRILD